MKIIKQIQVLVILLFFTPLAHSFPVAEGVNAFATMIGVLTSIIAGVSPRFLFSNKGNTKLIALSVVLFLSLIVVSIILLFSSLKAQEEIETAIQSRPLLLNNVIAESKNNSNSDLYNFEDYKEYVNNNTHILLNIDDFYEGKFSDKKIVNLDYQPGGLSQYPNNYSLLKFDINNPFSLQKLINLIKKDNNIILISNNTLKSFKVSKEIYDLIGITIPVIQNYSINYENSKEDLHNILQQKGQLPIDIFSANLIDLRSREDINQTHTLENADNLSIGDLYNMTDKEIVEYLSKYKDPIFISFHENDYIIAESRLKNIQGINYSYLIGGLNQHFDNGQNLTPKYLNMGRYLTPEFVMNLYTKDGDIKFICTETKYCLDNFPEEDSFIFSYRELGKNKARELISSINKNYRYIVLSNNQETDGNAILTGYWLNKQNINFLGTLPIPDRFSLEYIRHRIIENDNISLEEYRKIYNEETFFNNMKISEHLKEIIKDYGWLSMFFILGLVFRLSLFKFQFFIYDCYYKYKTNVFITLLSSFIIISLILFSFNILNGFLINYGVIPPRVLDEINQLDFKNWLALFFSAMVIIQSYITFPVKKTNFYIISALVLAIYFLGYIHSLNLPILLFLTASEIVSLSLQFIFYFKFMNLYKLHKKGMYIKTFKGMPQLPEKWLLVNEFVETSGLLIRLDRYEKDSILNYVKKYIKNEVEYNTNNITTDTINKKYIIRSCSSEDKESKLAGYYESIVCNENEIINILENFKSNNLDYVWIQPYYKTDYSGVIQSMSLNSKDIILSIGKHNDATEGNKNADTIIIQRKNIKTNLKYNKEIKLLLKLEKFYNSPIIVEFGKKNNTIILYQVRIMNENDKKIFYFNENKYVLSESFLTKSTYLTGSILELITNKDIVFLNGFLYEKKIRKYKKLYSNEKDIIKINNNLIKIEDKLNTNLFPMAYYNLIEELLKEYSHIYKITQSFKTSLNLKNINIILLDNIINEKYHALNAEDLELSSNRLELNHINYDNIDIINDNKKNNELLSFRDYNHYLIVKINYLLHWTIIKYCHSVNVTNPWDLTIQELMSENITNNKKVYDNKPINKNHIIDESILVKGIIKGKIFLIDNNKTVEENLIDLKNNEKYILAGEEIGSGWVKYLDRFSGVISVYGHPASHIAISAKELNIPYRKVGKLPMNNINYSSDD